MVNQPGFNPNLMQPGDSALFNAENLNRASREGRRGTRKRPEATSVYTQVAEEVREFTNEMREEFKVIAPIMKQKLTRAQARSRLAAMTPAERIALSNRMGRRQFAQFALSLQNPRGTT